MAQHNQQQAAQPHILVVDDDSRIRDLVSRYLKEHGFIVITAEDAADAREIIERFEFDAMVVDVMMPGESGLDFTKSLRDGRAPILLLTALGEVEDRVAGLEVGADDYLPKPFEPRELVARLNAILRRTARKNEGARPFKIGNWYFDPEIGELSDGKNMQRLTSVEINLLVALASRPGEAISREELAGMCGIEAGERTIDVQVTRLRRKIEDDTKAPRHLQTIRGKGYLLRVREI